MTKQPFAAQVCRLMVSTPKSHVITWVITHLPIPDGWKAELAYAQRRQKTASHKSRPVQSLTPGQDRAKVE